MLLMIPEFLKLIKVSTILSYEMHKQSIWSGNKVYSNGIFFPNKRTSRPKVFMSDEHHITLRYRVYTINSFGNNQWIFFLLSRVNWLQNFLTIDWKQTEICSSNIWSGIKQSKSKLLWFFTHILYFHNVYWKIDILLKI